MRRIWQLAAGLVVMAAGGLLLLGWKASSRAIHPPRPATDRSAANAWGY